MKHIFHSAKSRGHANHGWLDTYHSFSFADYNNPERHNFGKLRVLNDDIVKAGMGFATHGHRDMEIISIVLEGELEHQDNMGNTHVIRKNDVQVMSAGTGIQHSEKNRSHSASTNFLQIWLFPREKNVKPRYDQVNIDDLIRVNELSQILSPNEEDQGVWIYQDAWFVMGKLNMGWKGQYKFKDPNHGVYAFVIEGQVTIEKQLLNKRDGFGIWDTEAINILVNENTELLLMEVPMIEI